MPFGRRCALACESWPDSDEYSTCPACGEETARLRNLEPIDEDEASKIKNDLAFEEYYQRHCERIGVTDEGPFMALV